MGNSTKELVNAFNLNNYGVGNVNTNFTVEGKKIFGLFASGTNIEEYLQVIGGEIIKQHYGTKEVAGEFYNLNYFPFVLGANPDKEYLSNGIVRVKLADSTNNEVIRNLKVHFANEFKRAVKSKVVARLQKAGITKEGASEWVIGTVKTGVISSPYLYCIAFSDEYLKRKCDSETFEVLKGMYIQEFNSRLKECGLKSSGFYEYKDDMLYIKDVSDKVVESVAEYVKEEVAFDFRTPGSVESKVENCKNVLSDLILRFAGRFVDAYDYDTFIDENKIKNGHSFALIPLIEMDDGQFETLSSRDASKINKVFNGGIFKGFTNDNFMSDIRGKTANPQFANCKEPVYAFSNKQIAQLLPEIMESPIAYNERNGCFEFAVDLENFKRRGSSRSSSTVTSPFNSPTHAEPSGLRTPPNQRDKDTDSGYDSNSPPKPRDSGSSSGGPRSLFGQPQTQRFPTPSHDGALKESPGQGSEKEALYNHVNPDGPSKGFSPSPQLNSIAVSYGVSGPSSSVQPVSAAQNVRAGTSAWSQPINPWSSPAPSAGLWSLPQSGPSSWKGANKSMRTEKSVWYVSSSYSPGVEDVNDVEPEKQQVSDECSEAKSQKSESPKEHGGRTILNKVLSPFKRNNKKRSSTSSSVSAPGGSVTEKPPVSKSSFSFPSRIRAKSNPPSKVTSPTHEGAPGGLKPLTSDERKELRPFLCSNLKRKLDSNSLEGEQFKYLLYAPGGKREIKDSFENPEENLRRSVKAQLPGGRSSQTSADSGLGKSLKRGQSPSLIEKFSDELLISSRVDSPNIKKHLQKEKEVFV